MASVTRRRIAVFTGKRGGFGAMFGIMRRIKEDPALELKVIASDMHLAPTFGATIEEVKAFVKVDAVVDLGEYGDAKIDRARALGRLIDRFAPVLQELQPDVLLLLGDRGETLAAAMCAVEMGVPVAHIQAGDISGGIDDLHRHAITKLSHLHFSQNESQRQRVIKLGESAERVWNSGAPYVDNILNASYPPPPDALASLGLPRDLDYVIVLQHSDTYRPELAYDHARAILAGLVEAKQPAIVVYPCSDPGYAGVIRAIEEFQDNPLFHIFRSVEALTFLGLLAGARALVGNSSAGIIEAPYFEKPFILVGGRQDGREQAANVRRAEPTPAGVQKALASIDDPAYREAMRKDNRPFGDGHACERIFAVLREHALGAELFRKRITY
jgi:UDP-N-acetylglucosamine 2-epimerase (non-hydrolysing)/GDP/UDP-N,N'-diacetylbacillosamine 2-epimerase (hydrolysing)